MQENTQSIRNTDDMDTPVRTYRLDDDAYQAAKATAAAQRDTVSAVVIRALLAYIADPQAFNAAVATIRGGTR